MKIYLQVLMFSITPQTWLFHLVALLTTAKKWTKMKNARAERAKLLFLSTKYKNARDHITPLQIAKTSTVKMNDVTQVVFIATLHV